MRLVRRALLSRPQRARDKLPCSDSGRGGVNQVPTLHAVCSGSSIPDSDSPAHGRRRSQVPGVEPVDIRAASPQAPSSDARRPAAAAPPGHGRPPPAARQLRSPEFRPVFQKNNIVPPMLSKEPQGRVGLERSPRDGSYLLHLSTPPRTPIWEVRIPPTPSSGKHAPPSFRTVATTALGPTWARMAITSCIASPFTPITQTH